MLHYKKGDLLKAFDDKEIDILIHQENCEGLDYFKGIAELIHNKFPNLTEEHVQYCKNKRYIMGTVLVHPVKEQYVVNVYGQYYRGEPSSRGGYLKGNYRADNFLVRTQALESALQELNKTADLITDKKLKVGLPLIASGLAADPILKAGMSDLNYFKKHIAHIVEENLTNFDVTVYYL